MSFFPWLSNDSTHRQRIEDQQRKIAELDRENNILAAEVRELRKSVARYQGQIIAVAQAVDSIANAIAPEGDKR